jgi:hypothetical protein
MGRKTHTEIIVRQPPYDGAARTLKQLKGYTNALAYVRGVVPDRSPRRNSQPLPTRSRSSATPFAAWSGSGIRRAVRHERGNREADQAQQ